MEDELIFLAQHYTSESYATLNTIWPWRRVLHIVEFSKQIEFRRVYPLARQEQLQYAINSKRKPPELKYLLPDYANPWGAEIDGVARYSADVLDAFEHALELGFISNGVLAALDTRDLRASGAEI